MLARAINTVSQTYTPTDYISLDEAKTHLRLGDMAYDDAYIGALIAASLQIASDYIGYPIIKSTVKYVYKTENSPNISDNILKVLARVISIDSVQYYDADGVLHSCDYAPVNNVYGNFGVNVYLNSLDSDSVTDNYLITASIGFDKQGASVDYGCQLPDNIKYACLMVIANLYDNRQDVVIGASLAELPMNSKFLLNPYKIQVFV